HQSEAGLVWRQCRQPRVVKEPTYAHCQVTLHDYTCLYIQGNATVSSIQGAGQAGSLFFRQALPPSGWARVVRLTLASGRIASVETNAPRLPGESSGLIAVPAAANLHSHAFQRGMAGLAERPGPRTDSFWTWREVMYRFLGAMTPEDVEAIA